MNLQTDRVTLEILKHHFTATAEAMAYTLVRTAHTTFIKESADYATGLSGPTGELFAFPRRMGVSSFLGLNLKVAIDALEQYAPGDVVITNDPYSTAGLASHLPDVHMFKPIFYEGRLLCYAWAFVHLSDVGGLVPASISPAAEDIHQEGLRLAPRKLYRAGELDGDLQRLFLENTRTPVENWGDLKAMLAALNTAEHRFAEIAEKFSPQVVVTAIGDMLDWSEANARAVVAGIPDGEYRFSDYLDGDLDGVPIRLAIRLGIDGTNAVLDYSDSDPQVKAAFNLPAFGERHPLAAQGMINFILTEDPSMPLTGGLVRPLRTVAPSGSIINPQFPAAVGVRYATVMRLYNVVMGALAQAIPDRVPAAGVGQGCMVVLSVPDPQTGRRQVAVLEPFKGGGGATHLNDGVSGTDAEGADLRNTPVESIEHHIPVLIERYELLPESAGAGLHRGGWGMRLDFRILRPGSIVTARGMERCRFEPWGLAGGRAAGRTRAILDPGTDAERELGRIEVLRLSPGQVVSLRGTGGGGYGDPLWRDPAAVAEDCRSGLLSEASAELLYGVVITGGALDLERTEAVRARIRDAERDGDRALIDLGPARRAYERRWTEEASDALARLLLSVPVGVRAYAKSEIHQRLDTTEPDAKVTIARLRQAWRESVARTGLQHGTGDAQQPASISKKVGYVHEGEVHV